MQSVCLMLARFALSAWIGAAGLFVVTSVREVLSPEFNTMTKDLLVALRFPPYYVAGFTLMSIGLIGTLAAKGHPSVSGRRWSLAVVLLILTLALMLGDFVWIYRPLAAMISPPGQVRTDAFANYHHLSEGINSLDVALCFVAALLLCWPSRSQSQVGRVHGGDITQPATIAT